MVRTIEELSEEAGRLGVLPDAPLERYLNSASLVRTEGYDRYEQGDIESAFIYLMRFVTLIFKELQRHPDWREPKSAQQRNQKELFKDQAMTAISLLEDVKRELVDVKHTDDAIRRREAQLAEQARREAEQARQEAEAREAQARSDAARRAAHQPQHEQQQLLVDPSRILSILNGQADAPRGTASALAGAGAGSGFWGAAAAGEAGRSRSRYPAIDVPPAPPSSYLSFLPPPQQYGQPTQPPQTPGPPPPPPPLLHTDGSRAEGVLISTEPDAPEGGAHDRSSAGATTDAPLPPSATDELLAALAHAQPLAGAPEPRAPRAERGAGDAGRAGDGPAAAERARGSADDERSLPPDEGELQIPTASPTAGPTDSPTAGPIASPVAGAEQRGSSEPEDEAERSGAAVDSAVAQRPRPPPDEPTQPQGGAQQGNEPRGGARSPPSSEYPNEERPHTSFTVEAVPRGPIQRSAPPSRDKHAVGAPPPPKLSARPAPTTQDQRERLRHHLELRGFVEQPVPGDGNCQFHALVDQLQQNGVPGVDARSLRLKAVAWLRENAERQMDDGTAGGGVTLLRESIGVADWSRYLSDMRKHGVTWGDEGTLLAVSALYRAEIVIISSLSEEYCHIVHPPPAWKIPLRMRLYLGHYHEFHYVSVRFA
jgi:hypothetical protein